MNYVIFFSNIYVLINRSLNTEVIPTIGSDADSPTPRLGYNYEKAKK